MQSATACMNLLHTMDQDPEIEAQSWLSRLIDSPRPLIKGLSLVAFLMIMWLVLLLLHTGIEHELASIAHNREDFWTFVWLVLGIVLLTSITCGFALRVIVQARYREDSKRLHEVTKMLEVSTERIKALSELKELIGKDDYLLTDDQVQQKEQETDKKIMVVSVDLFFEKRTEWMEVIAANVRRSNGPLYEYFVRDDALNRAEEIKIREALLDRLNAMGTPNAQAVLSAQFKICYLSKEDFPHVVFNGFAIYRNSDQTKDLCLLYFPREQWKWNVNLLAGRDEAKRREAIKEVAEAESQLEALRARCSVG